MSSTERAPEPTMDEILASIRRIISEDESNAAREPRATFAADEEIEILDAGEGEADNEIINDIARVLSGGAPAPVAGAIAADEPVEDDILDLTAELGGLEPVEELELVELTPAADAGLDADAEEELALDLELVEQVEAASPPEPEPQVQASAPEPQMQVRAPEPMPAPAPQPVPPQRAMSASEEAASALERAIAALRAGQVPTSSSQFTAPPPPPLFTPAPQPVQFQPEPEPVHFQPEPEPVHFEPQPEPVHFEPEPVQFEPEMAQEPAPEAEPEFVLAEFETIIEEEVILLGADEGAAGEDYAPVEEVASWGETEEPTEEPEQIATKTNGSSPHEPYADESSLASGASIGGKTLEDSIKDMIRPMLRQWLDENMARVLTSALKDELKNEDARGGRD